jgi:hypothetical protein
MIFFVGSGLLIGGLIGARFTVLALIPAAVLTVGAAAFAGALQASADGRSPYHLIALLVFLQIGYLCGAGLSLFAAAPRAVRRKELDNTGKPLHP